jgi:P27 family predicted phage terminase small subunit
MKGRKPKPTALKILEGNPGKRPLNQHEPKAARKLPRPPKGMSDDNKRVWRKWGRTLLRCGIATQLDGITFALLIGSLIRHQEAADKVAEFGPVFMEKGSGKIPKFQYSPWWVIQNREFDKLKSLLTEFGMTPSSRSKVMAPNQQEEPDDPLIKLMRSREQKRKPG